MSLYFQPITIRDPGIIDRQMAVINDDVDFAYKYWVGVNFKKRWRRDQRKEALDWALGESGQYANFLKVVAVKYGTHIKSLLVGDFKRHTDGSWRVHIHGVLRSTHKIVCRRVKSLWRFGAYGMFLWVIYKPEKKGVAYALNGHSAVYWGHPACPMIKKCCRGKKGCIHKRKGKNDLLF